MGLPVWDGNPEVFEIDPDGLDLEDVELNAGSTFDATGALFFSFGDYQVLPDTFSFAPPLLPRPVRDRTPGEFTVGSQNLEQFFSTAEGFDVRLEKASRQIREVLNSPDILAVQEVDNLSTLQSLATEISNDDSSVSYIALLMSGNNGDLNLGFLIRDSIRMDTFTQMGADEMLSFDSSLPVYDRPPLFFEGAFVDNGNSFPIKVINVHNRSLNDSNTSFVRDKRNEQAQSIAQMVQNIQAADAEANLVVIGDFNDYHFTDGYTDMVGQISGNFDPSESLVSGPDLVDPDLFVQTTHLPEEERYSFVFWGNAEALDHALTSQALHDSVSGFEFGRGNADVPESLEDDRTTPLRSADHDGAVLFITTGDVFEGVPFPDNPQWRFSTWFGTYFVGFFPWIYHLEHGWQYVSGESTEDEIFVYDLILGDWLFFSDLTYRWWYEFGDLPGCLFTFEGNTPELRFFARPDSVIISVP